MDFPADATTLRVGGAGFLTEAFRRTGVLGRDDAVAAVNELTEFRGGSTGRKATLSVSYRLPGHLPEDLFVKFSRDFDDPARDLGRTQMSGEVAFALATRAPGFPIAVPPCLFADYHEATGTGILITSRIAYGEDGIEPHYQKCKDYSMPDAPGHYRALFSALASLGGADKSGRLPDGLEVATDMRALSVGDRPPPTAGQLRRRVERLAELATRQPNLLPAEIVGPEFLSRLDHEVALVAENLDTLWSALSADHRYTALCHWNANVDNAWFWRDERGELTCGLLDWGCVGRMNLAMAIWGALCSAETTLWVNHFDNLIAHFVAEYSDAGGPRIDASTLSSHVLAYALIMGTSWLLDVPAYLMRVLPDPVPDRMDPRIAGVEQVRSRLLMMTNFLSLWQRSDMVGLLPG